jgi:hypothetical protein
VADLGMASGVTGDGAGLLEVKTPFCKSHRIKTLFRFVQLQRKNTHLSEPLLNFLFLL